MTVPGIGPYYARRIVQYGNRLGGYVSTRQLDEIDDLPDEVKKYMTIEDPHPLKLNINRLSLSELRKHPYINFYQAKAITDYRRLHGNIKSLQDLRLSKDFPQEAIDRLLPYVEY
jgi:DNA uptake protein ComE-like DNA-binding protein